MGDPTAAGPERPAADRPALDRPVDDGPADRAAALEHLRAELDSIQNATAPMPAQDDRRARMRDVAGNAPGTGRRVTPPDRPASGGWSPAVGASGSTDRRRVPPPDDGAGDAPGDPVTVAKAICLRLLTGSARTRADLAAALRRRGIDNEIATGVLDRLTEVGLIDDVAYAEAYVASRHRDRGLGRSALRAELRRKGVDAAVAADAAAGIDDGAERRRAAELVTKRLDAAMFAGPDSAKRRLLGYLARRGYPPGTAVAVVDEALRGFVQVDVPDPDDAGSGFWADAAWEPGDPPEPDQSDKPD